MLLGNVLHWEIGYLGRQYPVLPAGPGFARKVKPLVRLGEREMAAYCVLRGIDYQVEECPMAEGNRHLGLKEVLNALEDAFAGHQGGVPQRVLGPRARRVRGHRRRRASGALAVRRVRRTDDRRSAARSARCGPAPTESPVELRTAR